MISDEAEVRLERLTRHWIRGNLTNEEFSARLMAFVDDELYATYGENLDAAYVPAELGHSRGALLSEIATRIEAPPSFLAVALESHPPGTNEEFDTRRITLLDRVNMPQDLDVPGVLDIAAGWVLAGLPLPSGLEVAIDQAPPLTAAAWLRYLVAKVAHDVMTQQRIIRADLGQGCTASLVEHLRTSPEGPGELADLVGEVDAARLRAERRWGDLMSIAVVLAERGHFGAAHDWSGSIIDGELHRSDARQTAGALPTAHHQALPSLCTASRIVEVTAPLVLIDILADDVRRASARCDLARSAFDDAEWAGDTWALAGHRAIVDWVQSRTIADLDERQAALERIKPTHAWLGRLQTQIHVDLGEIAETRGDAPAAEHHHRAAEASRSRPNVELHFGAFPFDRLLRQLPCFHQATV